MAKLKESENKSEIVNQKKQFIFEVEQTSKYVFPKEYFEYYVYIKNISDDTINDFTIQIENNSEIVFEKQQTSHLGITIKKDEVKLYKFKAYCQSTGKYFVHFIGFGEETQILYQTKKIICNRVSNSEKLTHRINIYDFSPYESKYSMEASNYNNQTTQIFKNQKLPYEAKKQPFHLEKNFVSENIESQSFLNQYKKAKNTNEHVYQYISRENFGREAKESYEGENLFELFEDINNNSEYFKGKLFRSGTNNLLNNLFQFSPDGFIYRMGLLNSEIYHNIGVIPTYSYMSDYLFRWAPDRTQLLNLIPEKKAMKWDENIWAGRGWIVSRIVTEDYKKTSEYEKKKEERLIVDEKNIEWFEDKQTAEEFINKMKIRDEVQRAREGSTIIKYKYKIRETLYDTGVFYVNIPIDKIPSNFYLLDNKAIYSLINRAKPYGTKPIVNYIIERTFDQHMDPLLFLNYHKHFLFPMDFGSDIDYNIFQNEYIMKKKTCKDGREIIYPKLHTTKSIFSNTFSDNNQEMDIIMNLPKIKTRKTFDEEMEIETYGCETKADYKLKTLKDILNLLYQENYNDICFRLEKKDFNSFSMRKDKKLKFSEKNDNIVIKNNKDYPIEALKIRVPTSISFKKNNTEANFVIQDVSNRKHKISVNYDRDMEMEFVKYTYINSKNEEFIRERGYQNIKGISVVIKKIYNKKILIFLLEDENKILHYFHHVIVQDIKSFSAKGQLINGNNQKILFANNLDNINIIFETSFLYKSKIYNPTIIKGGNNWINLYRLNDDKNSYSYIKNLTYNYLPIDDILFYYDNINIPETSIIKKLRVKTTGLSNKDNKTYLKEALNVNYITKELSGYNIQLTPKKIEVYSHLKESTIYYQNKLDFVRERNQKTLIKKYEKLLEENYIFNEDIDIDTFDYLNYPNDYITIDNQFWYELSEFTDLTNKLNEVESISFVIEGYNTEYETEILVETLSETDHSSTVTKKIPSGYFRKKIKLLYPNEFLLPLLRVRFRFDHLNHNIKIFDTKIELKFKNKQDNPIEYEYIDSFPIEENITTLLENYFTPSDINNGLSLKYEFDDLKPGAYYQLNMIELEVIYEETDMNIMINDNKYKEIFYGINKSSVSGLITDCYLSGEFYNDVITMSQNEDNVGIDNKGIKLQNAIYQSFETRDDNITSIEIFPYSFKGNPSDILKIGLYTNSFNTPGKLLKEVFVGGWIKNNQELKDLGRIKYNFNISNLKINERYWFKIQVLNPQENSYYVLKGINKTKPGFKLLSNENNNYINTFSELKFNIYSKNISQSFNNIPILQEYFDNPYIMIGLHKNKGSIQDLQINEYVKSIGSDYMSDFFEEDEPTMEVFTIIKKTHTSEEELPTED